MVNRLKNISDHTQIGKEPDMKGKKCHCIKNSTSQTSTAREV